MYHKHPSFNKPSDINAILWRYLDFTKFVSLIDKGTLFFVRADNLDDPFEGAITKENLKLKRDFIETYNLSKKSGRRGLRKYFYINSWHMNEYESTAMWKLYLKSEEGVAIQTTFKSLTKSFQGCRDHDIFMGMVNYTDYENEMIPEGNVFNRFLHKRKSFEHEKEIRAIILNSPIIEKDEDINYKISEKGLYVKVNLNSLIKKVYISPYSKKWFTELVQSVAKRYKIKAEVIDSKLTDNPIF